MHDLIESSKVGLGMLQAVNGVLNLSSSESVHLEDCEMKGDITAPVNCSYRTRGRKRNNNGL
jgi:hypothetical protein